MIFGVRASIKTEHDVVYKQGNVPIANEVDLREWDSPVENQGELGSCVANAVTNAYELQQKKQDSSKFVELSRLYVYYHSRYIENTIESDYGVVYIKSSLEAGNRYGICREMIWPYQIARYAQQPTPDSYSDACARKITAYTYIEDVNGMLESLTAEKPIVIGMIIYESFMTLDSDHTTVPMPTSNDIEIGGHAVLVVGYNLSDQTFLIKNSFGTDWGDAGYARLPFAYVEKYAFDKWIFDINHK